MARQGAGNTAAASLITVALWLSTGTWSLAAWVQIPARPLTNLDEFLISFAQLPHL